MISQISSLALKLYFGSSSKAFGNLSKFLEIVRENLRKSLESGQNSLVNRENAVISMSL